MSQRDGSDRSAQAAKMTVPRKPLWRYATGYSWCMVDGAIVQMLDGRHRVEHGSAACPGSHRKVAINVSADEYPEFRAVLAVDGA